MILRTPLLIATCLALLTGLALAQDPPNKLRVGGGTDLPIPRFVSLGSSVVNLRRGPGKDYAVDWVLKKRDLPVEVVAEYEQWRRLRIEDGTEGWVHQTLIAGKRTALVAMPETALLDKADPTAPMIAVLRQGVLMRLDDCRGDIFCKVEVQGYRGYVPRAALYGLYPSERFED